MSTIQQKIDFFTFIDECECLGTYPIAQQKGLASTTDVSPFSFFKTLSLPSTGESEGSWSLLSVIDKGATTATVVAVVTCVLACVVTSVISSIFIFVIFYCSWI